MHERILAQEIINKAKELGKVKSITVEVGDLAHLPANEMEQVLKQMTSWKVNIIKKQAQVKCKCSYNGKPKIIEQKHDYVFFKCPKCNDIPKIISGKDIILKEVDIE